MTNRSFIVNPFSGAAVYLILAMIMAVIMVSCATTGAKKKDEMKTLKFYTGSYADDNEPGIHLYEYNISSGDFNKLQEVKGYTNPSFLAIDEENGFLFAVTETSGFDDGNSGTVLSFAIDKNDGSLSFINRQSSLGPHPCHINLAGEGEFVAVANYSGGSIALLPVLPDGSLEPATGFVQHEGSGPDERRQKSPHAHSVYPHINGRWLFSADLGIDRVLIYKIDNEGKLVPNPSTPSVSMEAGAGPRHIAFHPNGEWIYVVNELNSTVTWLLFDTEKGRAEVAGSVPTLPDGYEGNNQCADIHVHPGGNFLYASNRGHNSIAVFSLDDGRPVPVSHEPVRGEWPRNFNIDPSGSLMFVANQHSDNITVFKIDDETGIPRFLGNELNIGKPVCIRFLSAGFR
jgi:6-phosphogluconolactonase